MATAARLAIAARRNELARFTIVVEGVDMTGVDMAMQVRLAPDTPGVPLFTLGTVGSIAAEGLKVDSVSVTNGIPTSYIKGRINASTMTDATKVPYAGERGTDTVLAYAMQWTMGGDAQTRLYGDFIVVASAFNSNNAPANRPASYGGSSGAAAIGSSGVLTFGDQIIRVSLGEGADIIAAIGAIRNSTPRIVQTYGDRASIAAGERFGGMKVYVAQAISLGGGKYRGLWFKLDHTDLTNAGWLVDDDFANNWIAFTSRPILDSGVLYFPSLYILTYESQGGYGNLYAPAGSATYVASPVSTGNSIRRHVLDRDLAATGTLEDAIFEVDDGTYPLRDTNRYVVLAATRAGQVIDIRDYSIAGDVPGGTVPNAFAYGKVPDRAPFLFPGPEFPATDAASVDIVNITNPDLIALGFTRGVKGKAGYTTAIGDYRAQPIDAGDYLVCSYYLQADADGQFGFPVVFIYTTESAATSIVPAIFSQVNARVRRYYLATRLTAGGNGKIAFGCNSDGSANRVTVTGVQYNISKRPSFWIGSNDFPAPVYADPLMADQIYAVSDRALPFFAGNGMVNRTTSAAVEVSEWPAPALPIAEQPFFAGGRAQERIDLDPSLLSGKSLSVLMRAEAAAHSVLQRIVPVNVRQVPLATPRNIKCGYFGDSHSASMFARYLKVILAAWNINVTFYGTLDNAIGDVAGETRQYGEGRGGWGIANMFGTYQLIGPAGSAQVWGAVVGPGGEATYTGGTVSTRQATNPFLNNGTSGSTAPVVPGALPLLGGGTASGFRFDLVNYRTRFSLPADLDIILWEIGDNDIAQAGAAGALTRMSDLYPIMLAEMRRAWPSAKIVCWSQGLGLGNASEIRWRDKRPVILSQMAAVKARADANMKFVSTWMHHSGRSGSVLNTGITDAATGVTVTNVLDPTHLDRFPGRVQSLEALSAAIANLAGA